MPWVIFFIYGTVVSIQSNISAKPICSIIPKDYGPFYSFATAATLSGYFFTFMTLLMKIVQARTGNVRIPSIIALNVILMGLLATALVVVFNWNGTCIDVLGYVMLL